MQGQKQFTDKVVVRFRLSERVPRHNLYRRLDEVLDLRFLYEETQALYSHTGQPSLDPIVFSSSCSWDGSKTLPVTAVCWTTVLCG
jgi:hypothetical protein